MVVTHPEPVVFHEAEINQLTDISNRFSDDQSDMQRVLQDYQDQVERICNLIDPNAHASLLDLSFILVDGIDKLKDQARDLTADETEFLVKFPQILTEYMLLPSSKIPDFHLLNHFKNPAWVRPLTANEERGLLKHIIPDAEEGLLPLKEETSEVVLDLFAQDLQAESAASDTQSSEESSDEDSIDLNEFLPTDEMLDIGLSTADAEELESSLQVIDTSETDELENDGHDSDDHGELDLGLSTADAEELESSLQETDIQETDITEIGIPETDEFENDGQDSDDQEMLDLGLSTADAEELESSLQETDIPETDEFKSDGQDSDDQEMLDLGMSTADAEELESSLQETDIPETDIPETDEFESDSHEVLDLGMSTSDDEQSEQDILLTDSFDGVNVDNQDANNESLDLNQTVDLEKFLRPTSASQDDGSPLHQDNELIDTEVDTALAETSIDAQSAGNKLLLDDNQQELVDLVRAELAEIIDSQSDHSALKDKESTPDEYHHELVSLAEQVENISNALKLIGLEGLSQSAALISSNLSALADTGEVLNDTFYELLDQWPIKLLSCLQDLSSQQYVNELLAFLQNPAWLQVLSDSSSDELREKLTHPSFVEEEVDQRQSLADASDVSLELPPEVNHELVEGLLQDLPSQTEEFSTAIQNIFAGGSLDDIDVAQRIAHTLKGAANVVGVPGIANLTHHLEDILEAQAKAKKMPNKPLATMLVTAADCLESMSEALLGVDEAPSDAVAVLQKVLDWANLLDQEGVPDEAPEHEDIGHENTLLAHGEKQSIAEAQAIADTAGQNVPAQDIAKSINVENMLRIPAFLADELLRLAGENLISTSQIQENIKTILKRQEALRLHNQSLQQLSFDLEHLIDIQGITTNIESGSVEGDFDPLEMDQYHELHSVSRRLIEIAADSIEFSHVLDKELTSLKNLVINQDQLQKESESLVVRTRLVPIKTIIPRLKRGIRQASRVTGKQVELNVIDNDTYIDSEVLNNMIEPLMHVLRNAVDHGIESIDERNSVGKNAMGQIDLEFSRKGDQIIISVQDDGRGLDLKVIHEKAVSRGLLKEDQEMTPEALQRLVLQPGFTTRNEVTQVSGRGIGLDVVNVKIRELKGAISIKSVTGQGCRFSIVLPISSFSTHSLLVRARQYIYAISNRGIEEVLYPGLGELKDLGDESVFQLDDQLYDAVDFDSLLNLPEDKRGEARSDRPVILVREESGARSAILVQEVIDSRDVVVKPMGKYMPRLSGIAGATVLGDGSVAPVVDLPELLVNSSKYTSPLTADAHRAAASPIRRLPYVLVVDDSLSARRSLAQFVEDLGLEVRTARDGMEAVSLIDVRKPDLILVDMEMPRMNGLELTSHIRASANTQDMPVIMITSRSTDKHRRTAIDKGVDHYMVKPFAEDELAQHINSALEIA